ncbi:hypothetical protein OFL77_27780, partial [Escherichia coli]|uniref:hypothetical protein n=1 Tax=Escherichia coli TaxID=562 RepID=UPI0021E06AA2
MIAWTWYPQLLVLPAIVIYIAGCCFVAGRIDGIRDSAEGLVDEFKVFCWPIMLIGWIVSRPFVWMHKLGR